MSDTVTDLVIAAPAAPAPRPGDRWSQLVTLAADLVFETDVKGRFVFVLPDGALGWPRGSLSGQPSENLIGDGGTGAIVNPFRPADLMPRHRTWLRQYDGGLTLMTVSSVPIVDAAGRIAGARGIGVDLSAWDTQTPAIADRLRRLEALDMILARAGHEASAQGMMDAALWALIHALAAEGAAIVGAMQREGAIEVLHECGPAANAILDTARALVGSPHPMRGHNPDGRKILVAGLRTGFGSGMGLAIWRDARGQDWTREDELLAGSTANIARMILEYDNTQREMAYQAHTDPLTGLLNRRAFLDEVSRHIARLDRESLAGTLLYIDMDGFKGVNDRFGHALGDQVLVHFTAILRRLVRPSDLIARLGGDEFAIWLGGADKLTAAERADELCTTAPAGMQAVLPAAYPDLGVSIGIAMRQPGSMEPIGDVLRRADQAMYEVKRTGRRHWRVSLPDGG